MKITVNTNRTALKGTSTQLKNILRQSLNNFADELGDNAQFAIESNIWFWPRNTRRKSGQFVPKGDRDIFDTGQLYRSYVFQPATGTGFKITLGWSAPHAKAVRYGSMSKGGKVMPGRDWIQYAKDNTPRPAEFFKAGLAYLGS